MHVSIPINDDLYVSGGEIDVDSEIAGDLVMVGGDIEVPGKVLEDLIVAGGQIKIYGDAGDDLRVAGGKVIIEGNVGDDALLAGGEVRVKDTALIKGDMLIGAGETDFAGLVLGNAKIATGKLNFRGVIDGTVKIYADEVEFMPGSQIRGNLRLEGPEVLPENADEVVVGDIQFIPGTKEGMAYWWFFICKLLFLLIFGTLLYFGFEKFWREVADNMREKPGLSFIKGLLYFLLVPFFIFLFCISVIGIPIALFLAFLYVFTFVFFELFTVIIFTGVIVNKYFSKDFLKEYARLKKFSVILFLSVLAIILCGLDFIPALFALGALITQKQKIWDKLKEL